MTDVKPNEKPSPHDIELLMPWHAAGTLNSRDAEDVDKALSQDKDLARRFAIVRKEMTETIHLNEMLGAPSSRAMENLFKAIDKEPKAVPGLWAGGLLAWLADLFTPRFQESRMLVYSASAAAIIMVVQAGVIAHMVQADRDSGATFQTASAPMSTTRGLEMGSYAMVRFVPQANIADLTRFLDSRSALIVDGPRQGGFYRVRIAPFRLAPDEVTRAITELRSASKLISTAAATE